MAVHGTVPKLNKGTCLLWPNKKLKSFNNTWLDTNQNGKAHLLYKFKEFIQKCDDLKLHRL